MERSVAVGRDGAANRSRVCMHIHGRRRTCRPADISSVSQVLVPSRVTRIRLSNKRHSIPRRRCPRDASASASHQIRSPFSFSSFFLSPCTPACYVERKMNARSTSLSRSEALSASLRARHDASAISLLASGNARQPRRQERKCRGECDR